MSTVIATGPTPNISTGAAALGVFALSSIITAAVKLTSWGMDHLTRGADDMLGLPPRAEKVQVVSVGGDNLPIATKFGLIMHTLKQEGITKEAAKLAIDASNLPEGDEDEEEGKKGRGNGGRRGAHAHGHKPAHPHPAGATS